MARCLTWSVVAIVLCVSSLIAHRVLLHTALQFTIGTELHTNRGHQSKNRNEHYYISVYDQIKHGAAAASFSTCKGAARAVSNHTASSSVNAQSILVMVAVKCFIEHCYNHNVNIAS